VIGPVGEKGDTAATKAQTDTQKKAAEFENNSEEREIRFFR